jgi:ketosteroid isomerase-like protein
VAASVNASAVADTLASLADRFSRAYMAQDLGVIASAYTDSALALPGQGPIVRGRDSVTALFAMPEGARLIHHRIVPLHVQVDGNMASDVGFYEAQAVVGDDTTAMAYGKYTVVWRRGEDGIWRMAIDMWSSLPQAPEASAR